MEFEEKENNFTYPVLETERLLLRIFEERDFERAYKLFNDADVQKYLSPKNRRTREHLKITLKRFVEHWEERGFGILCVTEKNSGEMIGYCGFQPLDKTNNIEILFALLKEYWGQGFAVEAAHKCLDFGFEKLAVDKIYAATVPQNTASRKVLEKLGMHYDEKSVLHEIDVVLYSISREDFCSKFK